MPGVWSCQAGVGISLLRHLVCNITVTWHVASVYNVQHCTVVKALTSGQSCVLYVLLSSFVRSIFMDQFTEMHICAMEQGGNDSFRNWLSAHKIDRSIKEPCYLTKPILQVYKVSTAVIVILTYTATTNCQDWRPWIWWSRSSSQAGY